jgi:tungstate transport system permease protein
MRSEFLEGIIKAFELIFSANPVIIEIASRSILISSIATLLAVAIGFPLALMLVFYEFKGKRVIRNIFNTLLGIPTVTLGLIFYLLFSRKGLLGFLQLLYTPTGIILGQAALILPIVVSFVASAIEAIDPAIRDLARTLGASDFEASLAVLFEARAGTLLTVMAAFNRAIAELGVALMIGGNIRGVTRVLTTAIALETAKGEIALGIALGIILLAVVFTISFLMNILQRMKWS